MMGRQFSFRLALCALTIVICFLSAEITIRLFGSSDLDGNFSLGSRRLKPYYLPVRAASEQIDRYVAAGSSTAVMYDPMLGWAPGPHGSSKNGLYRYNALGIRSAPLEYSLAPLPGVLRIALFGDSWTHGDDVPFENTWGYYLESELKAKGINAEVLNFGAGGYGNDQAYLRWKHLGYKFSPHIVMFGFQAHDIMRNVNLIRLLCDWKTGIPFSKPRFILRGNHVRLINSPTLLPEQVSEVIKHIDTWDLAKYEYCYYSKNYQQRIWLRSRLLAWLLDAVSRTRFTSRRQSDGDGVVKESSPTLYTLDKEPSRLTIRIIGEFKRDVESHGAQFIIVNLPSRGDIADLLRGKELRYAELLEVIGHNTVAIRPEKELLEQARASSIRDLFAGHYSATAHKVIADVIARSIMHQEQLSRRRSANR